MTTDEDPKILTKVVVGSRLHGLATPESDWDYRGIHMHDLKQALSPFKKLKNTTWIEGDEDNTSYELADFCKNATQGNATILEVFFSNSIIDTSPIADELRANWRKFIEDMGFPKEGETIERIDNNKGYNPDNCRWATMKEQAQNRGNSHFIYVNGMKKTIAQWIDVTGEKSIRSFARFHDDTETSVYIKKLASK